MIDIYIMLAVILWLFSIALREGFQWSDDKTRMTNPLIKHKEGKGLIDYHPNRIIEALSVCIIIGWNINLLWVVVFFPLYETIQTWIVRCNRLSFWECVKFQKKDWSFQGYVFERQKWMPWWLKYILSIIALLIILL